MANQTAVTTTQAPSPLFFSKVSPGPRDSQLLFKQIHLCEARNNFKEGIFLGLEMLMIDEERGKISSMDKVIKLLLAVDSFEKIASQQTQQTIRGITTSLVVMDWKYFMRGVISIFPGISWCPRALAGHVDRLKLAKL
ncbi:hypothetical protein YC2023_106489 [Brassica napus]